MEDLQRDLQKALCGFHGAVRFHPTSRRCATGNWGCGAFGGSSAVKVFIQWMAASLAGLETLEYFPWDDMVIHQLLGDIWDGIGQHVRSNDVMLRYVKRILCLPEVRPMLHPAQV